MKRILAVTLLLLFATVSCSKEQESSEKPAKSSSVQQSQGGAARQGTSGVQSGQKSTSKIFRTISSQEAQNLIKTRDDLVLVDLREAKELKDGYIAGSLLIPMSDLSRGTKSLPSGKPLLLICAVGGRSYAVGRYYSAKGYSEIYNLQGGISSWKKAGLPLQY